MPDSYSKKEREKKKNQKKKEKQNRKEARSSEEKKSSLDDMMAYVDENGMIVDTPPDENVKKKEIKAENIEIGVPKKEDIPEDHTYEGKVSFFNSGKGYGFIKDKNSQESYFVHINNCRDELTEGDRVEFEVEKGERGLVAVRVKKT